jgi:flavin reductase (DIM6/NTAB) family NADH-FMN oxidoreductase RutF
MVSAAIVASCDHEGPALPDDPYRPLKNALGRFATGVTVAACVNPRGGFTAITVNSFASVSLEPALVLWCIEKSASSFDDFAAAKGYSISILTDAQQAMSERFARHAPAPLAADEYETWKTGAPILKERLAAFDCEIVDRHRSGDHVILVGKVLRFDAKQGAPLLYFASGYERGPRAVWGGAPS